MTPIEARLRQLSEPEPSPDFSAQVVARIAALDVEPAAVVEAPAPVAASAPLRDRLAVAMALIGGAVGASAQFYRFAAGELTFDITSPRVVTGLTAMVEQASTTPATAVALLGLGLYLSSWLVAVRDQ